MAIKANHSRRKFIKNVSLGMLGMHVPVHVSYSSTDRSKFDLANLDEQIIDRVRQIASGRKVSIAILQPKGSLGNVKPIGDIFKQKTGVEINYIEASLDEINAKILAQTISSKTYFDIALPATFGLPDLIEAGAIRDLDEFVEQYEPLELRNGMLYPIGDQYKGKFYGYQTDGDTYVMFYKKSFIDDDNEKIKFKEHYGYELGVPSTWEKLDDMIEFFHRPDEKRFGGALYRNKDYIAWEWWSRFHAKGCFPFDDNLNPQINSVVGVQALNELIKTSSYLYPQAKSNGLFENWEAFAEGNIFCNIGWGGTQKYLNGDNSKLRNDLAFGPTPGGYVEKTHIHTPYFNWGWNYTVSNNSSEPELAYLFTLFACSPKMSTLAVQFSEGYFDPFRDEHYLDEKIEATYSREFLDTHKFSMKHSIPDLYLSGQGEYWDALKDNIDLADRGKLSPQLALNNTAKIWKNISSRYGIKSQQEQWMFLKSQYPEKLQSLLK